MPLRCSSDTSRDPVSRIVYVHAPRPSVWHSCIVGTVLLRPDVPQLITRTFAKFRRQFVFLSRSHLKISSRSALLIFPRLLKNVTVNAAKLIWKFSIYGSTYYYHPCYYWYYYYCYHFRALVLVSRVQYSVARSAFEILTLHMQVASCNFRAMNFSAEKNVTGQCFVAKNCSLYDSLSKYVSFARSRECSVSYSS